MRSSSLSDALALLLPSCCAACDSPRRELFGAGLCPACWQAIRTLPPDRQCPTCALPTTGGVSCRSCTSSPPPFSRAVTYGLYEGILSRLIVAFKFHGFDILAAPAARRMTETAQAAALVGRHDAVVAVPSTRGRNRERGFDPGPLLAREVARNLSLPYRPLLRRARETAPQSGLPAPGRFANVAGAFSAVARLRAASLLLVDDVVTTGATAIAAASALLAAGAARVDLLVLARTDIHASGAPRDLRRVLDNAPPEPA